MKRMRIDQQVARDQVHVWRHEPETMAKAYQRSAKHVRHMIQAAGYQRNFTEAVSLHNLARTARQFRRAARATAKAKRTQHLSTTQAAA